MSELFGSGDVRAYAYVQQMMMGSKKNEIVPHASAVSLKKRADTFV